MSELPWHCGVGSIATPGAVSRLDLAQSIQAFPSHSAQSTLPANVSQLLADERCPLVLTSSGEASRSTKLLQRWSSWAYLKDAVRDQLQFDAVHANSSRFTYWDDGPALAAAIRTRRPPAHDVVTASGSAFLDAVDGASSAWSRNVRFGASLHKFSETLSRELRGAATRSSSVAGRLAPLAPPGVGLRDPLIMVSAPGITCAAHFDTFSNTHLVVLGRKRVRLAPPTAAFELEARPGVHPMARQARRSLYGADGEGTAAAPPSVGVLEAELRAGDALFIPPGWLHEFRAEEPSAALSLTANSREFVDFNRWAVDERKTMLPFLQAPSGRPWSAARLASALLQFIPSLLEELGLSAEPAAFLRATFLRSYNAATKEEAGLPSDGWRRPCEPPTPEDAAAARDAAATVAARFRERYDPEQRAIFVMLFLENVASMAATAPQPPRAVQAAPGDDRTAQLGTMVGYVEACLAAAPEAAAVAKDEV